MSFKFTAKAHLAHTQSKPDELSITPGDIINVTNADHNAWWVGVNTSTGESGWFPANYVDKIEEQRTPLPARRPKKPKRMARVLEDFEGTEADDLTLKTGDVVEILKEYDGWYYGKLNGETGMFPGNYVEDIVEPVAAVAQPLPPVPSVPRPTATSALPPLPSRTPTAGPQQPVGGLPAVPPVVPAVPVQSPPLPPRTSVDQERKQGEEEKKDKHKSKRISRLFSTKKSKSKEQEQSHHHSLQKMPSSEGPSARSVPSAQSAGAVDPPSIHEEDPEESTMSPALPSRPLPQPSSNPFAGRPALPQLPKVPPAPSAAVPPPPAAAPPMLGMTTSLPPLPVRRPSASSVASGSSSVREGSVPLPPLPPVQQLPKTVDEEVSEEEPDLKSADEKKQDEGETTEAATGSNQEEGAEEEGGNDAESTAPASKPRSDPKLAKIIEDYEATSNEELNLISGDVVTIIHRGTDDEPRWKGEYHGKKGYFPSHVVEAISESAGLDEEHNEDESGDPSESKPKGFKLAAYGVQQGGLGSIFAGGGMPMLRKSATSSKKDDVEDSEDAQAAAPAPAPAPAPMMHKLRSVRRPPPKEEVKEEVPNFLAQLNRVPRKSSPSVKDEEPVPAPAPAPALPRKTLSRSSTFEEPAAAEEPAAVEEPIVEEPAKELPKQQESPAPVAAPEPVAEEEEGEEPEEEESEDEAEEEITPSPAKEQKAVSEEPAEKLAATEDDEEGVAEETQDRELPETTQPKESLDSEPATESPEPAAAAAAEEEEEQPEELPEEPKQPALDPVKAPSLPHVKRLVRRAPRQKPTSEALKKQVEEDSQSKTLQTALEKDKDAPIEESPAKATPPPVAEKPKGLGGRAHFGGPQLPTGGFKATGRVGSAMAERLAALQARASGAMSEESEEPAKSPPSSNENRRSFAAYSPPQPRATTMSPASVTTNIESPSGGEWQRQVEEEQKKLRGDVEKASRAMADVEALAGKLRASEQEQTAQKQTIAALESKLETMARQLSKMQEEAGEARQALARLEANRGVSAEEVTALLKKELQAAVEPLRKQTQDLSNENIKLRDDIKGLKTYIDELVVEEEE